jgi:stromal membrane-associated protein
LEAFAAILAIISPRALVSMEPDQDRHGGCSILARVPWFIFAKIQSETKPWWSNSIGQYNFLNSCVADDRSRIAQMMVKVGAKEVWTSIFDTSGMPKLPLKRRISSSKRSTESTWSP